MLALQSAPLHLRDQSKQERRFDQPLLFTGYSATLHHHHHNHNQSHRQHHNHPRHHSYHHPTTVSSVNSISSSASTSRHQQHQALFYRECDLKQDLSVTNAKIIMHHNLTNNIINTSSSSPSSGSSNHSKNSIQFDPTYNNLPSAPLTPIQNCTGPYEESSPLQTPIKKINDRIDQMSIEDCSKEKIVLILTGSFCPIHVHHIEMLKAAKETMEKGQDGMGAAMVLGGFVSPSHDAYVGQKLKGDALYLNSEERMELCRLQTADSDWIDVDPWEATQSEFYDYHKVTSRLQQFLHEQCQSRLESKMHALLQDQQMHHNNNFIINQNNNCSTSKEMSQGSGSLESKKNPFNIRVVYICGADFVLRTGAHKLFGGLVVVDRPLGPPSGRRSILLINSGGHINVPVSDQADSSEISNSLSPTGSTSGLTVKERVFQKLTKSYGAHWCEASMNNIWWLPTRSSSDTGDISSTRIRKLLTENDDCAGLLHPAVAKRLREKLDSKKNA